MSNPRKVDDDPGTEQEDFARQAEADSPGLVREFLGFLGQSKKWWLLPILLSLLLIWGLILVGGTSAAPFIYTLF